MLTFFFFFFFLRGNNIIVVYICYDKFRPRSGVSYRTFFSSFFLIHAEGAVVQASLVFTVVVERNARV